MRFIPAIPRKKSQKSVREGDKIFGHRFGVRPQQPRESKKNPSR